MGSNWVLTWLEPGLNWVEPRFLMLLFGLPPLIQPQSSNLGQLHAPETKPRIGGARCLGSHPCQLCAPKTTSMLPGSLALWMTFFPTLFCQRVAEIVRAHCTRSPLQPSIFGLRLAFGVTLKAPESPVPVGTSTGLLLTTSNEPMHSRSGLPAALEVF